MGESLLNELAIHQWLLFYFSRENKWLGAYMRFEKKMCETEKVTENVHSNDSFWEVVKVGVKKARSLTVAGSKALN